MATTLSYTVSDFVPFTKIISADMNSRFNDIKNRVNWAGGTSATTGLGDDNLQSNTASGGGLTRSSKLKAGTANAIVINAITTGLMSELTPGTAGQFLQTQGASAAPVWAANPLSLQYNVIIGSAAQVTAGVAQYSSIATYFAAAVDDDKVLLLSSYSGTENVTLSKRIYMMGQGRASLINGTMTFATGSNGSRFMNMKIADTVTINSGVDEIYCDIVLAVNKSFTDNSDIGDINWLLAMQED